MSSSTDARTVTMLQERVQALMRENAEIRRDLARARGQADLLQKLTPLSAHTLEIWFGLEGPAPTHPALHTTMVMVDGEPAAVPVVMDPPPALAAQYDSAGLRPEGLRIPWVGPVEIPPPTLGQAMLQVRADGRITTLTVPVRCLVRPDLNPPELYICLTPDELISLIELADGHPWEINWQHPLKITPEVGS